MLRRFYSIQQPLDLTLEEWDELMDARATIVAIEDPEANGRAALAERKRRRG